MEREVDVQLLAERGISDWERGLQMGGAEGVHPAVLVLLV